MKITLYFALLVLLISGCSKTPTSAFYPSKSNVLTNEELTFNNLSTSAKKYLWSFGDGTTSTEESPKHNYSSAGTYTVTLIASSKNEKKVSSTSQTIQVADQPLVASFSVQFNGFLQTGKNLHFIDSSVGGPTSWSWNFGDGATSNERSPFYTFGASGYHIVTLIVTKGNLSSTYQLPLFIN